MLKRVIEKFSDKTIVLASGSPRRQEMLQKVVSLFTDGSTCTIST